MSNERAARDDRVERRKKLEAEIKAGFDQKSFQQVIELLVSETARNVIRLEDRIAALEKQVEAARDFARRYDEPGR